MNDTTENNENTSDRPLGFWLRTVDHLITLEFARTLAAEGIDRREWMLLNVIDGSVDAPWLLERLARKSGRVRRLIERGWIAESDGTFSLTEEGTAAKERLGGIVDGVRARVSDAVSPEDYATTLASLQKMAEALGYDEESFGGRGPGRGFGRHRGFGPGSGGGFGPGFGGHRGFGFGPGADERRGFRGGFGPGFGGGFGRHEGGFGPHDGPCAPHEQHEHGRGHGRGHRHGERAYERGFTAGFERGRAAASEPAV
ncbi:MarR family winged helix-turn-helix transcriptional regulator [Microbacterium sp. P05]|uniref:MarR family winged helix-turn-helix transcriptional regulator n=1 Tax=Microbacterium sp. P05 TaxID=3366948 RepID=UPI0037459F52